MSNPNCESIETQLRALEEVGYELSQLSLKLDKRDRMDDWKLERLRDTAQFIMDAVPQLRESIDSETWEERKARQATEAGSERN